MLLGKRWCKASKKKWMNGGNKKFDATLMHKARFSVYAIDSKCKRRRARYMDNSLSLNGLCRRGGVAQETNKRRGFEKPTDCRYIKLRYKMNIANSQSCKFIARDGGGLVLRCIHYNCYTIVLGIVKFK